MLKVAVLLAGSINAAAQVEPLPTQAFQPGAGKHDRALPAIGHSTRHELRAVPGADGRLHYACATHQGGHPEERPHASGHYQLEQR